MAGDNFLSTEILRHGAYVCLRTKDPMDKEGLAQVPIAALAARLGLHNEFTTGGAHPADAIAFLLRRSAVARAIEDFGLERADCVIHVASINPDTVMSFCVQVQVLLERYAGVRILSGVVRPKSYTGGAMERWAYTRAVTQQPGAAMPNAFVLPMSKTPEWWRKDWMERHTYFLPRYDEEGRMVAEGHALAGAAGVPCIYRRSYHALEQPAPQGAYDFMTYFECADVDIPVFDQVCANLRDIKRNPEWRFVREGPTWRGRRVPTWQDLFSV